MGPLRHPEASRQLRPRGSFPGFTETRNLGRLSACFTLVSMAIGAFAGLLSFGFVGAAVAIVAIAGLGFGLTLFFSTLGLVADGTIALRRAARRRSELRTRETHSVAGALAIAPPGEERGRVSEVDVQS